jgi:hypothetical protein
MPPQTWPQAARYFGKRIPSAGKSHRACFLFFINAVGQPYVTSLSKYPAFPSVLHLVAMFPKQFPAAFFHLTPAPKHTGKKLRQPPTAQPANALGRAARFEKKRPLHVFLAHSPQKSICLAQKIHSTAINVRHNHLPAHTSNRTKYVIQHGQISPEPAHRFCLPAEKGGSWFLNPKLLHQKSKLSVLNQGSSLKRACIFFVQAASFAFQSTAPQNQAAP